MRVAERAAFLDIVSGGRLELGLARSGGTEWDTFGVDPERSRDELREALHMIPRVWTESPFKWESERIPVPERDIVPKSANPLAVKQRLEAQQAANEAPTTEPEPEAPAGNAA